MSTHTLSVVVPALNEEARIGALIETLRLMPRVSEIIVCDGGSHDRTVAIAREMGAVVVQMARKQERNRGAQMNLGAQASRGSVLWFLHADVRPHRNGAKAILQATKNERVCGGNFRLRFDDAGKSDSIRRAARLFEAIARVQRRLGIYYGDSGIWVRRDDFAALGGYQSWPLFEDYDFVRRLEHRAKSLKRRTLCLGLPLVVSSRRFRAGANRLLLRWATFQVLFWLGVSPHRLARLYHS